MSEIIDIIEQLLDENGQVRADDNRNLAGLFTRVLAAQGKPVIIQGLAVLPTEKSSTSVRISTGLGFSAEQGIFVLSEHSLAPAKFLTVNIPLNGKKAVFNLTIKPIWSEHQLPQGTSKEAHAKAGTTQNEPSPKQLIIETLVSEGGVTDGYIKIAEVQVEADTEMISADNIKNISAEDFNSVNRDWLAEQTAVYRLGTIDSLEARLDQPTSARSALNDELTPTEAISFDPASTQLSAEQVFAPTPINQAESDEELMLTESVALDLAQTSNLNRAIYSARDRVIYLPLKDESLTAKFALHQWQNFADQAKSNYPFYFQPSAIVGSFEIDVELSRAYSSGTVQVDADYVEELTGDGGLELYLATSADGLNYTDFSTGASLDLVASTKFVRIKLIAVAETNNLFTIGGLNLLVFSPENNA